VQTDGLDELEKLIHLTGSRTRDLPACSSALTATLPGVPTVSPRREEIPHTVANQPRTVAPFLT
jgi:hypothetical protein